MHTSCEVEYPWRLKSPPKRLQHPTACLIQNDRRGLEICQTLSFWIKMANRVWKGSFEEDVVKNESFLDFFLGGGPMGATESDTP